MAPNISGGLVMSASKGRIYGIGITTLLTLAIVGVVPARAQAQVTLGGEIRARLNDKCLDIRDQNPNNGAKVQVWDCWSGANQRWYWTGGQIRSALNGKCLDIRDRNPNNGAKVQMWSCWSGANQRWYRYGEQIRSSLNGKCLDIRDGDPNNGATVQMWSCWSGVNQRWYF